MPERAVVFHQLCVNVFGPFIRIHPCLKLAQCRLIRAGGGGGVALEAP